MKIAEPKVYQIDLPLKEDCYNWSNGNFVEVFTDEGITGYAECCPLSSAYLPSFSLGTRAGLAELAPHLIGFPAADHPGFDIAPIFGALDAPVATYS